MEHQLTLPIEHWGLERWPFPSVAAKQQVYPSLGHREALARIDYLVEAGRRMGMLLGEPGVGKSLALRTAEHQLTQQGRSVVLVDLMGVTSRELLWQLAARLGAAPPQDADVPRLWRLVADRIVENRWQRIHTVLLADDAGLAGPDVAMQLVRLARLDPSPAARWTLVLAAEPAQAARWSDSLRNLCELRIDLRAWEPQETIGYVQSALVDAGRFEPLFDDEALAKLHELTRGVPRQVTRLADFALLAGAAAQRTMIDAAVVEEAHQETTWPATAATC